MDPKLVNLNEEREKKMKDVFATYESKADPVGANDKGEEAAR